MADVDDTAARLAEIEKGLKAVHDFSPIGTEVFDDLGFLLAEVRRLQAENAALRELGREETWPIQLNSAQATSIKQWAADNRLWTTQDTVEANLRVFARVILRDAARAAAQPEEP